MKQRSRAEIIYDKARKEREKYERIILRNVQGGGSPPQPRVGSTYSEYIAAERDAKAALDAEKEQP
jgi:hypothetical protein